MSYLSRAQSTRKASETIDGSALPAVIFGHELKEEEDQLEGERAGKGRVRKSKGGIEVRNKATARVELPCTSAQARMENQDY
jgi:hypothetical protein